MFSNTLEATPEVIEKRLPASPKFSLLTITSRSHKLTPSTSLHMIVNHRITHYTISKELPPSQPTPATTLSSFPVKHTELGLSN